MQLGVVAEGVATEAQLEDLRAMGCDCAQGDHFQRPVTAEEMTRALALTPLTPRAACPT